jgi:hypothetical protein
VTLVPKLQAVYIQEIRVTIHYRILSCMLSKNLEIKNTWKDNFTHSFIYMWNLLLVVY